MDQVSLSKVLGVVAGLFGFAAAIFAYRASQIELPIIVTGLSRGHPSEGQFEAAANLTVS